MILYIQLNQYFENETLISQKRHLNESVLIKYNYLCIFIFNIYLILRFLEMFVKS